MSKFKPNDIVIYNDDISRTPYLIHDVIYLPGNTKPHSVSLGLEDYPDTEQDYYTSIEDIIKLSGKELRDARKLINKILVS
jgi:hypothetical protein